MTLSVGVVCHYGVGGSARVAVDLTRELATRGHAVHLFARSAPFGAQPPDGVTLHALQDRSMTTTLDTRWSSADLDDFTTLLCDVVRQESLDVLHFHYAIPFVDIAQAVQARLGAAAPPMVLTLHGTDVSVYGMQPALSETLARGLGEMDAVTTVSHSHAALATEVFALDQPPLVIPNFVNIDRFHPGDAETGRLRITYVSNFREIKQPVRMARIIDDTLGRVDAEVWLVGDGECMPTVRDVLAEREALGQVHRLGVRLDLENILPQVDAMLVTSQAESFCLVALEAMAAGVPVVAPRVGGIPELVQHGRSGLLFDPGDDAQATRYLTWLMSDPALRYRMSFRSRARALDFSSAAIIPRYERLYALVLRATAEPAPIAYLV